MSTDNVRPVGPPAMHTALGVILLLVAALDITLLLGIGWSAWQKASLSERWLRMCQEDQRFGLSAQGEVAELRSHIANTRENILSTLPSLPSIGDIAAYLSDLPGRANLLGLTIVELSPLPDALTAPPVSGPWSFAGRNSGLPVHRFKLCVRGPWPQLVLFFKQAAQAAPPTAWFEQVDLRQQGGQGDLSIEIWVLARPTDPLVTGTGQTGATSGGAQNR